MLKRPVHAALARLKTFLESRGARVALVYLPPGEGGTKVGLDDFLAQGHGLTELLALARKCETLAEAADGAIPEAAQKCEPVRG